jgi:hypothetical protein
MKNPIKTRESKFRKFYSTASNQLPFSKLFIIYLPAFFVLFLVGAIGKITNISISNLSQDISSAVNLPPYLGALSNLGILLWFSTAVVCFFGAAILKHSDQENNFHNFILYSGFFSAILALDDLFLLHESNNKLQFLEISIEKLFFLFYAIFSFLYIIKFWRFIYQSPYFLFLMSLVFFTLSILLDSILESPVKFLFGIGGQFFLEDGFKWLGIVSWFSYFLMTLFNQISSMIKK